MVGMVLVQEDDSHQKHFIHCLSKRLVGPKIRYYHVEKLALFDMHAFQKVRKYIIPRRITIIANSNPFQHILSRWIFGGKYNK